MTPNEIEAVRLRWHIQHPEAAASDGPTEEEAQSLLVEIRQREGIVEAAALSALRRATRNPASISGNSKHVLLFLYVVVAVMAIAFFVALVGGGIRLH